MGHRPTRQKLKKFSKKSRKRRKSSKKKQTKTLRKYSKKRRIFHGGMRTVPQQILNCHAHALSRCIYRLFKELVRSKLIDSEKENNIDFNILLNDEHKSLYHQYIKIHKLMKFKEHFEVYDVPDDKFNIANNIVDKVNEIISLYDIIYTKKNNHVFDVETIYKLYGKLFSFNRSYNDENNNIIENLKNSLIDDDKNDNTMKEKIDELLRKLEAIQTNMKGYETNDYDYFEDTSRVTLFQTSNNDFNNIITIYNTYNEKNPLYIDKLMYNDIIEIEKNQENIYNILLPIFTYDTHILQFFPSFYTNIESIYTENDTIDNLNTDDPNYKYRSHRTDWYYTKEEQNEIIEHPFFSSFNNIKTIDNDNDHKQLLKQQIGNYINLMTFIPKRYLIKKQHFKREKQDPIDNPIWITNYIHHKKIYKSSVESIFGHEIKDENQKQQFHAVAITTDENNETGIIKDDNNIFTVTFKHSNSLKYGYEGKDTIEITPSIYNRIISYTIYEYTEENENEKGDSTVENEGNEGSEKGDSTLTNVGKLLEELKTFTQNKDNNGEIHGLQNDIESLKKEEKEIKFIEELDNAAKESEMIQEIMEKYNGSLSDKNEFLQKNP